MRIGAGPILDFPYGIPMVGTAVFSRFVVEMAAAFWPLVTWFEPGRATPVADADPLDTDFLGPNIAKEDMVFVKLGFLNLLHAFCVCPCPPVIGVASFFAARGATVSRSQPWSYS